MTKTKSTKSGHRPDERLVDSVLEYLPIAAARVDRRGTLRFVNSEWCGRLDRARHEVVGRCLADIISPDAYLHLKEKLARAMAGETVTCVTDEAYPAIGVRRLDITLVPDVTSSSGQTEGVLIFIHDTTEQISLQSARKNITDYITALNAHAIVAVTDARGVITWVNDKFCKISQYSREELYGKTHALVNSGHHPKRFFIDFWETITRGRIWQGEICNRAKDGSLYWVYSTIVPFLGADDRPEKYIAIRADITKLKQVEQEAQYLSRYDFLTGLPNRRMLQDRLDELRASTKRTGQYCALLAIDLDEFKKVNDYFGHPMGDRLLVVTARRLTRCLRQDDMVARMGGDEFQIILGQLGENIDIATQRTREIGSEVLAALTKPYYLDRESDDDPRNSAGGLFVGGSIGAEVFCGTAVSSEELFKQVDLALYRAKHKGRNRLVIFDATLQKEADRLIAMEHDLRGALTRGELALLYQPIVDSQHRILGMEALLRWEHAERGVVLPDQFIALAEQIGLIVPIGDWVLARACEQLAAWAMDPVRASWTLSVNVSARQFNELRFVDQLFGLLERTGARPERLMLELTEGALLAVTDSQLLKKIDQIRQQGVQLALDDFGTGYSSLTYLRRLPLDRVKIDRSFVKDLVHNPKDQGVVQAILTLARTLDLHVVAEGVETAEQFQHLCAMGCLGFQGYWVGQPMSATAPLKLRA